MRILITGATGLLGTALLPMARQAGHDTLTLGRRRLPGSLVWDPLAGQLDGAALEGVEAVVHLAGEGIAARRWSAAQKDRIRSSRVRGTELLARTLAGLAKPPKTLVCASAVGFYGDRGDEPLDEDSSVGRGFLAEVCRDWEAACEPARQCGIRVVSARFGVILDPRGGALRKMLLPFKLGLGGRIGSGRQWMGWIAVDDAAGAVLHALDRPQLSGPVLFVAPAAVTNAEFTRTLGRVLGRPTVLPLPALAAKLAFGEMAEQLLLAGQRVRPLRLLQSGYRFRYEDLEAALRHLLGR